MRQASTGTRSGGWLFIIASVGFFVGGGYFGYAVAFPMVAKFLVSMAATLQLVLKIDDYLDILSKILLGMGLASRPRSSSSSSSGWGW